MIAVSPWLVIVVVLLLLLLLRFVLLSRLLWRLLLHYLRETWVSAAAKGGRLLETYCCISA